MRDRSYLPVWIKKDAENLRFGNGVLVVDFIDNLHDWIDGCNRVDLVIATSTFSKDVLLSTKYDERNKTTNELINQFKVVSEMTLNKNRIINHEALMSHIVEHTPENFTTFEFDTWYHDDFWKTTPYFDNDTIKNKTHFVHFFEKELKL